ncbi:MAG: GEVED domain-containing protein [Carboxylicivirga sp.]|jgi:photosystem II stability/assembly factor-like uncharacterized protein|nr:GEVED domain-containing protein [Carboxylicivirga sp.]
MILDKNAYEYPVWEEILLQEKVKVADVILAFKAYRSTHDLDKETIEHFEKLEKRLKVEQDIEGYVNSEMRKYLKLQAYREARRNDKKAATNYSRMVSSFKAEIPNKSSYGCWKNVGPFGDPEVHWAATGNGAIQYLEMHPHNPAIMYACSRNGGLWKTNNYGKNWTPETDYFATNNTSCIEVCPHNPSILYLGAAEDQKIWYSSDSGNTWEDRSSGISGSIYDIHSDPANAARAIVATTNGIFLTTNSGQSWAKKLDGKFTDIDLTNNWDLIIVSDDNDYIEPVFYFSKNKGESFKSVKVTSSYSNIDRFYLAIHKSVTGTSKVFAYGILNSNKPTRFVGLWESDYNPNPSDGKSFFNFTRVKHSTYNYPNGPVPLVYADNVNGFQEEGSDYYGSVNPYSSATWISDFFVSPNNPQRVLTFREKFWGSEDGGVIWEQKPSYGGSNWADNRYVTMNVTKDTLYWCNDGGIWSIKEDDLFPTSADVAASGMTKADYIISKVVSKNGDICVSEGTQMDVSQMNKGVFITGGQDIGQVFTRNGRDSHVASADVYRGRIKPNNDEMFITGGLDIKIVGKSGDFYVGDNIEADHFNADQIYGFTNSKDSHPQYLVRSPRGEDGWKLNGFVGENKPNIYGHGWTPVHNNWELISLEPVGVTNLKSGIFEQSRANKELAFVGDEYGERLFYTDNLSASMPTWKELANAPKASRYRIATHQYNENNIVLATNKGVFVSKDKGQTWNRRGSFPESNPRIVLLDKNTQEGIYVMTELTVYYIDESLSDWIEFNKGLPLQNLSDMRIAYYPDNDNRLYVSKYGRGVWTTSLYSVLKGLNGKPKAAFSLFGNTLSKIAVGETITLIDQSLNATKLEWKIQTGDELISISDNKMPEFKLLSEGYYKVTLTATNDKGTDAVVKENYIHVVGEGVNPVCGLTATGELPWYKGIAEVRIDGDAYETSSRSNYIKTTKTFQIEAVKDANLYIKDVYSGYNFYIKAWIDFNNDGDFDDAGEEVATSGGKVDEFTSAITVPNNATFAQPLLMRVGSVESDNPPTACQSSGMHQTIDFKVMIGKVPKLTANHSIKSKNSATLEAAYSEVSNGINNGFVYSRFDGELDHNNSNVVLGEQVVSENGNYSVLIKDLEYNSTYYYRPYVLDIQGIHYGKKQSFKLAPFSMPMAESLIAINVADNKWNIKGIVYPEGNVLDGLSLEYGSDNFDNHLDFDPSLKPVDSKFSIDTDIDVSSQKIYQFRIKYTFQGEVYYSNTKSFDIGQKVCIPAIDESTSNNRISNVTFDGNSKSSSGNTGYEDFSNLVYNVTKGKSYSLSVKAGYDSNYKVFIDYNNDGDFNDYHEEVAAGKSDSNTFNTSIKIPIEDVAINRKLRMRIVAYNGNVDYCHAMSGEFEDYSINIQPIDAATGGIGSEQFVIYPNPTNSELFIDGLQNNNKDYLVEIFDLNGSKVYSSMFRSTKEMVVNVRSLPSGLYTIRISCENEVTVNKFIKIN